MCGRKTEFGEFCPVCLSCIFLPFIFLSYIFLSFSSSLRLALPPTQNSEKSPAGALDTLDFPDQDHGRLPAADHGYLGCPGSVRHDMGENPVNGSWV